jgi:hypothetical protein
MTPEQISQIEQLVRIGAVALQQGKSLEESQQIGLTALSLIDALKSPPPTPETDNA